MPDLLFFDNNCAVNIKTIVCVVNVFSTAPLNLLRNLQLVALHRNDCD